MSGLLSRYEPQYTVDSSPKIPCDYLAVAKAGSGGFADVHFCVPRSFITSTRDLYSTGAKQLWNMGTFIQAVKVSKQQGHGSIADEIAVLKSIQQEQKETEGNLPFFKLVAWDTYDPVPRWLATSAFPVCCDLATLCQHEVVFPQVLVWLTFVQLYEALEFLYGICDPPLAHNDLHTKNVIIGYSETDVKGLPQVKIIDFGLAGPNANCQSPLSVVDAFAVLEVVHDLIKATHPTGKARQTEKTPFLDPSVDEASAVLHDLEMEIWINTEPPFPLGAGDFTAVLQQLWRQYSAHAKSQIATVSASSIKQVENLVRHVAMARSLNMEHRIVELLNDDTIR